MVCNSYKEYHPLSSAQRQIPDHRAPVRPDARRVRYGNRVDRMIIWQNTISSNDAVIIGLKKVKISKKIIQRNIEVYDNTVTIVNIIVYNDELVFELICMEFCGQCHIYAQ